MKDELKSSIEFNTWFTTYIDWELTIRNGEEKLGETQDRLLEEGDESERLKLLENYVDYYEQTDIEGTTRNIYQVSGVQESSTTRNLFDLYSTENGCDVVELTRLYLTIREIVSSGAKQSVIYQFLKSANVDYAREKLEEFNGWLYDIRRKYQLNVWYCKRDSITNAKKETKKIVLSHGGDVVKEALSELIYDKVVQLFPWYKWAVIMYETAPITVEVTMVGSRHTYTNRVDVPSKGDQFLLLTETQLKQTGINVALGWVDGEEDVLQSCRDIPDTKNFLPFKFCEDCVSSSLKTSNIMISGLMCPSHLRSVIWQTYAECLQPGCAYDVASDITRGKYSFLAYGSEEIRSPCDSLTVCSGQGKCYHVPDSSSHMCVCYTNYEGENCETYNDPVSSQAIEDMVASFRLSYANFIGLPTVIDVYLAIDTITDILRDMQSNILSSIDYANLVSLYGDSFREAEFITEKYKELKSGVMETDEYKTSLEGINYYYVINGIESAIMGTGLLVNKDFMSIYKRSLSAQYGDNLITCSEEYYTLLNNMMNNLVTLDQVTVEAMVWEMGLMIQDMEVSERESELEKVERIVEEANERRDTYRSFWRQQMSCPTLTATHLVEKYCVAGSSYENLQVSLTCTDEKVANPSSVTCSRNGGTLEWSEQPQCVYEWSSWSSWSACSTTCDNGQRTRTRTKPNGEVDNEAEICNEEDCCQERYNKFKCNNNNCVSTSQKCDGRNDCGDNSDENLSSCTYLRSGDTIALRTSCKGDTFWLSCWCTVNCGHPYCKVQTCPGETMDYNDWEDCSGARFNHIAAVGRGIGDPIRHGDKIAIRYCS
ncbi:hypothetical protein Pmani_031733 [Petrolisthes manimaculis]|uniref:EGF-like domain-containing protein n=1 Tax=Petrolisthes manimaculis TaxID=1843537 RepID=A0AAE1NUT2_9EUCA|nr:hypothetical protein Pmani_031733 [Petrolisthes manimaculis]